MAVRRSRLEKYPDTDTFHFHNENPKNRITCDCAYRAIARGTGIPYNEVVMGLARLHCETGFECTDKRTMEKFLKEHGWVKHKQPRKADNTKYTGREFCREFRPKRAVAMIGGHHMVAIVDGKINDIWNSTDGCIGTYWTE